MYTILKALANFLMISGVLMCVLGLIAWFFEMGYKKKHGPIQGTMRTLLYGGIIFVSVVLAVPLHFLVFKSRRPAPKIDPYFGPGWLW